jgi:hypothetical protein
MKDIQSTNRMVEQTLSNEQLLDQTQMQSMAKTRAGTAVDSSKRAFSITTREGTTAEPDQTMLNAD